MDLTDVDEAILDESEQGTRTQGYLVDATGTPRYKIHERLQLLAAVGYIENIHENTVLYELRTDPRGDSVVSPPELLELLANYQPNA